MNRRRRLLGRLLRPPRQKIWRGQFHDIRTGAVTGEWWAGGPVTWSSTPSPKWAIDEAIDTLFRKVDTMLSAGQFTECDAFLDAFDVEQHGTDLLVGILSITVSAQNKLRSRDDLVKRVESRLQVLAPDRIEGLMGGLT